LRYCGRDAQDQAKEGADQEDGPDLCVGMEY